MGNRITRAARHVPMEAMQERIRREKRPWLRQRWEIIFQALAAPRHAADIARTVGVSLSTVHRVMSMYKQGGVVAIETPGKGGRRHQYLTLEQEPTFLQSFLERAARGELTTAVEIQLAFEGLIGHQVNKSTLYRLLARHGLQHLTDAAGRGAQAKASQPGGEEVSSLQERRKQPSTRRLRSRELAPRRYPSDLSDQEWAILQARIPSAKPGGRPRSVDMREVINAILYLDRTGAQWRALPQDFPPWPTVWTKPAHVAQRWHLGAPPYNASRAGAGEAGPRTDPQRGDHRQSIGEDQPKRGRRGYDGGKKVKGRKRPLLVDTTGLIMHVLVHEADLQDHTGGKDLLRPLRERFPRLKLIWADSGYNKGGFVEWVKATLGWEVEIVEHPWSGLRGVWAPKGVGLDWQHIRPKGFHVLPRRWVVERTFAWLSTWRRLAKDYELLPSSEEAWIYIAMSRIMLRRLAQNTS